MGAIAASSNVFANDLFTRGFRNSTLFQSGSFGDLAISDVDQDGNADVLVASISVRFFGGVDILRGRGDGTFETLPYATLSTGVGPYCPVAADVNGDGLSDVAFCNIADPFGNPRRAMLHVGQPGGLFDDARPILPGVVVISGAADFDHDGRDDYVCQMGNPVGPTNTIVAFADSTLSFDSVVPIATGTRRSWIQDANNDGMLDVIVDIAGSGNETDRIAVFTGDGGGSFNLYSDQQLPATGSVGALCHLNDDSLLDAIVVTQSTVTPVLQNIGNEYEALPEFFVGYFLFAADVTGDGRVDLISQPPTTWRGFTVWPGVGGGHFSYPRTTVGPTVTRVADVNRDGVDDVVSLGGLFNAGGARIGTLALSDAVPSPPCTYEFASRGRPSCAAVADLDGDGIRDLIIASYQTIVPGDPSSPGGIPVADKYVSVLLGVGGGMYVRGVDYEVGPAPRSIAIGDLNRDGVPDLVVGGQACVLLPGIGGGGFGPKVELGVAGRVAIGDVNGDEIVDILVCQATALNLLLGQTGGAFAAPRGHVLPHSADAVACADLNGDSFADVIVAGDDQCSVLLSSQSAELSTAATFAGPEVANIALTDFNRDGSVDIIAGTTVLLGSGSGGFAPDPESLPVAPYAVGDFNLDGMVDLVSLSPEGVTITPGNIWGFDPPLLYETGSGPTTATIADVDGDALSDVVVTNDYSATVSVLLGRWRATVDIEPTVDRGSSGVLVVRTSGRTMQILVHLARYAPSARLSIFDVRGRLVETLGLPAHQPGSYSVYWNPDRLAGTRLPRGVYFVSLRAERSMCATKVVLTD